MCIHLNHTLHIQSLKLPQTTHTQGDVSVNYYSALMHFKSCLTCLIRDLQNAEPIVMFRRFWCEVGVINFNVISTPADEAQTSLCLGVLKINVLPCLCSTHAPRLPTVSSMCFCSEVLRGTSILTVWRSHFLTGELSKGRNLD